MSLTRLGRIVTIVMCGNALVACAGAGSDRVADEVVRPAVAVEVARVQRGMARAWVLAEGTARAVERQYLTFEGAGRVTFVQPGLRVGSSVAAGDLLARQDQRRIEADLTVVRAALDEASTQRDVVQAELNQAEVELRLAGTDVARFGALLERNSASPQEFDQATARRAQAEAALTRAGSRINAIESQIVAAQARLRQAEVTQEETEIRSPISGVVAYLNIDEGRYFMPSVVRTDTEQNALSTVPIVVIDTSQYEITVEVPAFQREAVRTGMDAVMVLGDAFSEAALGRLEAGPAETILPFAVAEQSRVVGTVYAVNPTVSPGSRTVEVRIRTTGGSARLQDGVFVTAWIESQIRADTLTVPLNAIVYRENRPSVFVIDAGIATERAVELGLQDFTVQEVVSGVDEGAIVVTDGRFRITSGTPVRVIDPER